MRIFIRADASKEIGTGHLMRCLSLSEELSLFCFNIVFVCREITEHLRKIVERKGFGILKLNCSYPAGSIEDAEQTIAQLVNEFGVLKDDWFIIDSYNIDFVWEREVKNSCCKMVVIDDLANRKHDCHVLIDTNLHENNQMKYDGLLLDSTVRLIGPEYSLLRNEFKEVLNSAVHYSSRSNIETIFVCFGGTDPTSETLRVVNVLHTMLKGSSLKVNVVVGESNTDKAVLQEICGESENLNLFVQPPSIARIMIESDLAICSGGSLTWERYCMGLPGLIITVADNQVSIALQCEQFGVDHYLGKSSEITELEISKALRNLLYDVVDLEGRRIKARSVVDGLGVSRVVKMLLKGWTDADESALAGTQ